jgi:hypothetical protein
MLDRKCYIQDGYDASSRGISSVRRRTSGIRITTFLICGSVVILGQSCGPPARPNPERYLTDPGAARRAVEESLKTWHDSPDLERTTLKIVPVMFVDQSRKPGQRLREFTIVGESAGADGCRRFQVKLALQQPDESMLVSYYVFGQGPIWVYRAEDFEMMMHMDPMTQPGEPTEPKDRPKAESQHLNHMPPRDRSETKNDPRPSHD